MQNKQNTIYLSFLNNAQRRISQWKELKCAYRLVTITYRMVRARKQYAEEYIERNLKTLKKILRCLNVPPMNPYYYWVERQLSTDTNGMQFNTKWY